MEKVISIERDVGLAQMHKGSIGILADWAVFEKYRTHLHTRLWPVGEVVVVGVGGRVGVGVTRQNRACAFPQSTNPCNFAASARNFSGPPKKARLKPTRLNQKCRFCSSVQPIPP